MLLLNYSHLENTYNIIRFTDIQLAFLVTTASTYLRLEEPISAAGYLACDELDNTSEELDYDWEEQLLLTDTQPVTEPEETTEE